jgi:hypothetical protein
VSAAGGRAAGGAALPAVRWPGPRQIDMVVEIPRAGVFLGPDRAGRPTALAAVAPRPVRIGMLGRPALAAVLAYRLLAVGCQVTVITAGAPYWSNLHAKIGGGRLVLADRPVTWPAGPAGPPGSNPGPQALILDYPTPPPRWLGTGPWCTVVHATGTPPADSEFWAGVDALLLTGPGYAAAAARRWPRADLTLADELRPGEIALADPAATHQIALPLAPVERELVG